MQKEGTTTIDPVESSRFAGFIEIVLQYVELGLRLLSFSCKAADLIESFDSPEFIEIGQNRVEL